MKPRATLILGGVVLAAIATIALWERHQPSTDERWERATKLLADWSLGDIQELRVRRQAGELRMRRSGEQWIVTAPFEDSGDRFAIEGLLRTMLEIEAMGAISAKSLGASDDLAQLGDPAHGGTTLELTGPDGRHLMLRLGGRRLPGERLFARRDEETQVRIVSSNVAAALDRSADELRLRTILDHSTTDVRAISLARKGQPSLRFERRAGQQWWIVEPIEDLAQQNLVSATVARTLGLSARGFAAATELPAGFDSPALAITVDLVSQTEPIRLDVAEAALDGTTESWVRGTHRPGAMKISLGELRPDMERAPDEWRSLSVIDISPLAVTEMEVALDGRRLHVRRVGGATPDPASETRWEAVDGSPIPPDERINGYLASISAMQALRAHGDPGGGLSATPGSNALVLRLDRPEASDQAKELRLAIGQRNTSGQREVHRTDRSAILELSREVADLLEIEPLFRPSQVPAAPGAAGAPDSRGAAPGATGAAPAGPPGVGPAPAGAGGGSPM